MEMAKQKAKAGNQAGGCCSVESVVTVDERGQMVLPKELREKAKIKAGSKFGVVSCEKNGEVCCLMLVKLDALSEMMQNFLGPVMKDIVTKT